MKNRTRSSQISKLFSQCKNGEVHIGLDVHKKSIQVAIYADGRILKNWVTSADPQSMVKLLAPYRRKIAQVVYEAGCTGYILARRLTEGGVNTIVAAPSCTPRQSGRKSKTDKVDARKLAEYSAKEMLTAVSVPDEAWEADRQILRLRNQILSKLKRIKCQIKSFMLYYGINEPAGLSKWTNASIEVLGRMELRPQLRFAMDMMLDELRWFADQLKKATRECMRLTRQEHYRENFEIIKSHKGAGDITALTYLLEVYREGRFERASQVASYTGLAPMIHQSGASKRDCGILRTGRGSVRSVLIQCAWQWIRRDDYGRGLFRRLYSNTGSSKKAVVGVARHIAVNLWGMLEKKEFYRRAI